jgi:hypothetical protein
VVHHTAQLESGAYLGGGTSASKHRCGRTRKGNTELCAILTECAWSAGRTATYVGAQLRRFTRRIDRFPRLPASYRYWPVLVAVSMARPDSAFLPVTRVRM